jgi:putative addiction module killer protein
MHDRVRETPEFRAWLTGLRDARAVARIAARVRRLIFGNPGDVKPVGGGLSELSHRLRSGLPRLFRPTRRGLDHRARGRRQTTQARDIKHAKALAEKL